MLVLILKCDFRPQIIIFHVNKGALENFVRYCCIQRSLTGLTPNDSQSQGTVIRSGDHVNSTLTKFFMKKSYFYWMHCGLL